MEACEREVRGAEEVVVYSESDVTYRCQQQSLNNVISTSMTTNTNLHTQLIVLMDKTHTRHGSRKTGKQEMKSREEERKRGRL